MWLLIFLFGVTTLLMVWTLFLYYVYLWISGFFQSFSAPQPFAEAPSISIIIPCYNEEGNILEKINNMAKTDYPQEKLQVIFIDGGSEDKTVEILEDNKGQFPYTVVSARQKGKTNQLNEALQHTTGEIIFNSDVDFMLDPDTVARIVSEFTTDPTVAVVGGYCYPETVNTALMDQHYWLSQNKGRLFESNSGFTSIVIAGCYAYRKELISQFPDDVVADDIYIAFKANSAGFRTVYSSLARAIETRGPANTKEFIQHKLRKSNAFLKESLRFAYLLPTMPSRFKLCYVTKIAQQLLHPWLSVFWLLIAGSLLTLGRLDIVLIDIGFILICFLMTYLIFQNEKPPLEQNPKGSLSTLVITFILTNFILLVTAVSYPFYRQNSVFSKVGSNDETKGIKEKDESGAK